MILIAMALLGAGYGLVIGGLLGFFIAKKKNANKPLWTIVGILLGIVVGGVGYAYWECILNRCN